MDQLKVEKPVPTKRKRKLVVGVVLSAKMQKTAVVAVSKQVKHGVYGKFVRRTDRFMVHDPESVLKVGDVVEMEESRPLSRMKRWSLARVVSSVA